MPKAQDIINGLTTLANQYVSMAIVWHVIFYAFTIALIAKWLPNNRIFALSLALPLLSVAVFAWISKNPFNGTIFLIAAILMVIFSFRSAAVQIAASPFPYYLAGVLMVLFGLVYPHFLENGSWFKYLYASPVGLVPCPTLSVVIGLLLMFGGSTSPAVQITLIILGLFYALFGILKLGVILDTGLMAGTLVVMIRMILSTRTPIS